MKDQWCDELLSDPSGHGLKVVTDKIASIRFEVKREMDKGLAPDEFEGAQRLLQALESADEIANGYWNNMHQS
ncbi:EscE/YscE/SsaE family type III secretion system needle protein co-chaperone [Halodesulfovibrio spirochaetisodalis]|uniref:Uncharacterized protein n=1 Tax=Halodesulfovibrio spirochaetisodalis TaxID=1560234 RepID=A0A1B7X989_9BACT|nr:EscE/YscE/SsaE family type III secretion system needle protein co-chaperone [Halodesulfovibrio spirochaetisodalis]OBQ45945.1 hypothetical protein SP90_15115 [Halodesulfovibrio spirochaetisodalis]